MEEITNLIPHRQPFLFVDRVVERTKNTIQTTKRFPPEESFFAGHFPGNPIVPGVILCEAVFQSGAILLSGTVENKESKIPVLTRIKNVRFKKIVRPDDEITVYVELSERLRDFFYLKGEVRVLDKLAVRVEFACALVDA